MTLLIEPPVLAENRNFSGTVLNIIKKAFTMFKRSLLLNIKFVGCCVIQKNGPAETVFQTSARRPAVFEIKLPFPGKP